MGFSTKECEWSKISVTILGAKSSGLRAFEINKEVEKEYLYAAGSKPIDIQAGNEGFPGTLTVLKYEFDKWNDAAQAAGYLDLTEVPHNQIVVSVEFKKRAADPIRFITVPGLEFSSMKFGMAQNDKMMEVPLPFLGMGMIVGSVGL